MWAGAQEIPRCVRHVRECGYPVACEQSETRGGEFEGVGYAEWDHGVSLTLVGNDNSPLILGENVASEVSRLLVKTMLSPLSLMSSGAKCSPRSGSARL